MIYHYISFTYLNGSFVTNEVPFAPTQSFASATQSPQSSFFVVLRLLLCVLMLVLKFRNESRARDAIATRHGHGHRGRRGL